MSWFREPSPNASLRVFCFPHAGGGSVDYRRWAREAPPHLDICPVLLPGREGRLGESPFDRMTELIPALAEGVKGALKPTPFLFLGHSMGAWIAYELAAHLAAQGDPTPAHLVVVARRAPQFPARLPPLSALPEAAFVAGVQDRYGAFPPQLLAQPALLNIFLPALRADFTLLDTYTPTEHGPLPLPITAIGGSQDHTVTHNDLDGWRTHTSRDFERIEIQGGHFLPREPDSGLLEAVLDLAEHTLDHPER